MSTQPLVVLLASLPGSGKYSFAPYLGTAIGASVLDTNRLFDAPRIAVGAALGLGTRVVDEPQWKECSAWAAPQPLYRSRLDRCDS